MQYLRRLALSAFLFAITSALASIAWAAPEPPKAPANEPGITDYKEAGGIVLLGLFLGFIVVLKPSNRRDRAKPQQYEVKAEAEGH